MASITIHIPCSTSSLFLFFFFFFLYIFFSVLKSKRKMASAVTHIPSSSESPSESPSESSSSFTSDWSCDVFLSFRGDTRYNFTDHLYEALKRNGINTFRDDESLRRGGEIAPELLKAIEGARVSIIVFSENYADSKWCLEEVAKIMECKKERNQTVIPIFYHVDPSEQVRKQRGSYGKAFALHEKGADEEKRKKIQKWKAALSEAGNLAGYHVSTNQYETKYFKEIINLILRDLNSKLMCLEEFIVGIDSHKKKLKSLLKIHRVVGIYGIGGIGKTTIAKIIYNDILSEFDDGSFLQNVREEIEKGHQLQLQQQLLHDITRGDIALRTINEGINMIKQSLHSKKVLIVIDDVDNLDQLELLVKSLKWFDLRSRIIITTRNRQLLCKYGENISSYEIKALNNGDAFQLFCWHAFEQNDPKENYKNISESIVHHVQGHPLAIKVIGSSLRGKILDIWKSAFDKLRNNLDKDIDKVLRISFEGLDHRQKNVFLDIACIFKGNDKDSVSEILENCGLHGKIEIDILVDKCLITISDRNVIDMHDLLQQMGWTISREENSIYKGMRLWDPNDIHNALSKPKGIENIEVISCDLSRIKDIKVNTQVFTKMDKLRLLKVYCSGHCDTLMLPKDFEFSSQELRYLYWKGYPLKTLPSNFQGENLVELDMQRSNIKQLWSGSKVLGKLKVMNLSCSKKLVKMSEFRSMPNLERLYLVGCTRLRELGSSIGALEKLAFLDLGDCTKLSSLPSSIDSLQSLEFLYIDGCPNLEKFPNIRRNMRGLRVLDLSGSGIKELPDNIQHLTSLKVLLLSPFRSYFKRRYHHDHRRGYYVPLERPYLQAEPSHIHNSSQRPLPSSALKEVPSSIGYLISLEYLSLFGCQNFEKFPEIHGNIGCLKQLDLGRTGIKKLPDSFKYLTSLEYLNLSECSNFEKFPEIFGNMRHLRTLDLKGSGIKELPDSFNYLTSLKYLNLSECSNLEKFPEIFGNMRHLRKLDLRDSGIKELPGSFKCLTSLEYLGLSQCSNFEKFPEIFGNMRHLRSLNLRDSGIKELPDSFKYLTSLEYLGLSQCSNFEKFPEIFGNMRRLKMLGLRESGVNEVPRSIGGLESLGTLDLSGCRNFERFPEIQGNMKSLKELRLENTAIKELPRSIGNLTCLESLILSNCSNLQKLPDNLRSLKRCLTRLDVDGCKLVEGAIPSDLWSLHSLTYLNICGNDIRSIPAGIIQLSRLKELLMNDCRMLEEIPELPSSRIRRIEARGCPGPCLETLLSNQSSKLRSLVKLDISKSDIRSIPAAIVQLSKLGELDMSYCKLQEEIPELPSSLRWIDARGCPGPCLETLLSNQSSKLCSLWRLDISQSDIRSIPAAIVQLSKLEYLYMNDCKLLEEITELPTSLRYLDAIGCPCLEMSVSKFWSFQIKRFISISQIEDFKRDSCGKVEMSVALPESNGIPEWVRHKSIGREVTIDLPPNWYNDNNFLGFAIFSHFFPRHDHVLEDETCYLECRLTISGGDQFEFVLSIDIESKPGLVVGYVPQIAISKNHRSNKWRKLKVTLYSCNFRYRSDHLIASDGKSYGEALLDNLKTKSGIHLIYAEVHQQQNEQYFVEWPRENENACGNATTKPDESENRKTSRIAKRRPDETENQRGQEPHHHKRSTLF